MDDRHDIPESWKIKHQTSEALPRKRQRNMKNSKKAPANIFAKKVKE